LLAKFNILLIIAFIFINLQTLLKRFANIAEISFL